MIHDRSHDFIAPEPPSVVRCYEHLTEAYSAFVRALEAMHETNPWLLTATDLIALAINRQSEWEAKLADELIQALLHQHPDPQEHDHVLAAANRLAAATRRWATYWTQEAIENVIEGLCMEVGFHLNELVIDTTEPPSPSPKLDLCVECGHDITEHNLDQRVCLGHPHDDPKGRCHCDGFARPL